MSGELEAFIRSHTVLDHAPLVPEVQLYLATELSPLWHATAELLERQDLPPPFWAFPWVGGQAVARYVLDHPELVAGKRVLDFAAGSGLCGLAAHRAGALSVRATELDHVACVAMKLNAAHNLATLEVSQEDLLGLPAPGIDVVLAGDIFYERPLAEKGMSWFSALAAAGVLVLAGDPGRIYSPKTGRVPLQSYEVVANPEVEEGRVRHPVVYTF